MKHTPKIIAILLLMFLVAQLLGLFIINAYHGDSKGSLPAWITPPEDIKPQTSLMQIVIAIIFGVVLIILLMKIRAELFLRIWFFAVIVLALSIAINAFFFGYQYSFLISLIIALPLAIIKVFKRNIIVHNLTELLIYPGIASLFVPILDIFSVVMLLILISVYDMWAVWHSGVMQKMAKYQIQKVRVFSGFFIPYLGKGNSQLLEKGKKKDKNKKVKVSVAILGGGDVVFPIILAGVVLIHLGLIQALIISVGATLALAFLFYKSEKGKFYPAMPFITLGCFIALGIAYLITYL